MLISQLIPLLKPKKGGDEALFAAICLTAALIIAGTFALTITIFTKPG